MGLASQGLLTLEEMSRGPWRDLELREPVMSTGPLDVRASCLRVKGDREWIIEVEPIDLAPKIEVFRLRVSDAPGMPAGLERAAKERWRNAGELLAAFVSRHRRIAIGTRQYTAPDWQRIGISEVLVEDVLVLRDGSGQQAVLTPDTDQPGSLRIVRGSRSEDPWYQLEDLRIV